MIEQKEVKFEEYGILIEGITYLVPPNPNYGYNCGYSIFVPRNCEKNTTLIMHSCNTGNNVPIHLEDANNIAKKSTYEKPNSGMWLGNDLKMPVMIPLIPRVEGYYTQSLRRKVFNNDVSQLILENSKRSESRQITQEEISEIQEQCRDLHSQVANMIMSSRIFLQSIGIKVDNKVIVEGYSAGAQFANYFTALHPELIKACICGGNSGLGIMPLENINGQTLLYPLGIADIPNFNFELFREILQLYYIGAEDFNDPVNLKYTESYSPEEVAIIYEYLGNNPQKRFDHQEQIYSELGINAIFKRYPGNHNTVTQNHNGRYFCVNESIKDFIRKVIYDEKNINKSL